MAFGGLSYVTKMAKNTANFLQGKLWKPDTFDQAMKILLEEMYLPPNVPGSMVKYRQTLAISLLFKSFLTVSDTSNIYEIGSDEKSSTMLFHKEPLKGSQLFEIIPETQKPHDPLRRPLKHKSADKQVAGKFFENDLNWVKTNFEIIFKIHFRSEKISKIIMGP